MWIMLTDIQVSVDPKFKNTKDRQQGSGFVSPHNYDFKDDDHQGLSLRSKWQVLGYLNGQADLLEK